MNDLPIALTPQERSRGQRIVRRYYWFNGVTVALLMESVLILYAIRNGVGDAALAVIASFIHLTMPLMLLGKGFAVRRGVAATWGWGWILRGISASVMIAAPFFVSEDLQWARSAIIIGGAFGFSAFRSIGLVGNTPMIGELTSSSDRGRFVSGNWARATLSQMATLSVVIVMLQYADRTWVFQIVIAIASVIGIYSGHLITRVPESRTPRESARVPLWEATLRVWNTPRMRRLLFAWAAGFASFTLIEPFAIITVKNGYLLSDYQALLLSLCTLAGGTSANIVNGRIADHVGPRPLMVIYASALAGLAVFWAFAPSRFLPLLVAVAFFLSGYAKFGLLATANQYFLSVADRSDRVGSAMILRATSGAVAGIVGSLIGGGLLSFFASRGLEGVVLYRTYFRVAIWGFLLIIPAIWRLERLREWSVRRAALLFLQPRRIIEIGRRKGR